VSTPNGQPAAVNIPYIDAVAVNNDGLVTQVSFYAAQSCNDNNIYFGAFSALTSISSSTEFSLTDSSNALSVDRTSDTDVSMELVTISLCIGSTPVGCQGNAFQINNGQYFGSYSSQCIMGYAPTSTSVYRSTYYQQSSNPFTNSAQPNAYYSNAYANVVLQYIQIQSTDTSGQIIFLVFHHLFVFLFFRFVHFNKYILIQCFFHQFSYHMTCISFQNLRMSIRCTSIYFFINNF
jgi:hypothetical protein